MSSTTADFQVALRVGLLLSSTQLPAWQASIVRSLLDCEFVSEVIQLILRSRATNAPAVTAYRPTGLLSRAMHHVGSRSPQTGRDALAREQVDARLDEMDRIEIDPAEGGGLETTLELIAARELDLIVALAEPEALSGRAGLSRLGIWYLGYRGRPLDPPDGSHVGLVEVVRRETCVSSELRIRSFDDAEERIAYETWSPVDPMSIEITRSQHLWKCSRFPVRALKRCARLGKAAYLNSLGLAGDSDGAQPTPRARQQVGFNDSARYLLWRYRMRRYRRRYRERWMLLAGEPGTSRDPRDLKLLRPPPGRFWADPHAVETNGAIQVFFEDASVETGQGRVATFSIDSTGKMSEPIPVIEKPYHLSYPFVFNWNGSFYMVPESAEKRSIDLYRCIRFPDKWTLEYPLMPNIRAYDATLFEYGNLWWMFANVAEMDGASDWDELHIYCADTPLSRNWQAHPCNPVVSDVRRARPAGPLFYQHGRLIRPSQDSSGRYGRALRFNEVLLLNEHEYVEKPVASVKPGWDPTIVAVHSYSCAGSFAFMDALVREPR